MAKDPQASGRLQATLDEMKRRLEEEREAAELLTRRLNFHRENRENREQVATRAAFGQMQRTGAPIAGFSPLENELNDARKQLHDQKALTEKWIEQVTAERNAGRARLHESECRMEALQEKLATVHAQMSDQKAAAEAMIAQLMANAGSPAAEDAPPLDAAAEGVAQQDQQHLREQQNAAEEQVRTLTAERERMQSLLKQLENRAKVLDEELVAVRSQMDEQRRATEDEVCRLTAEREQMQLQIREQQARSDAQAEELDSARRQFEVAEDQIRDLAEERDQGRARYDEIEQRTQQLQQEFIAAHEQFREQRETAVQVIRQLELDREETQARLVELQAESVRLHEEATKARNDLRVEMSKVGMTKQVRNEILDAVVDIQIKGQKLLDLLQSWSAKDADANLEVEVPELVGFFDRK